MVLQANLAGRAALAVAGTVAAEEQSVAELNPWSAEGQQALG